MKYLLEVLDHKAKALIEVLDGISYVKTKPLTENKALILSELKEAIDELGLVKAGKKKTRNAEEFLNEL